MTKKLRILQNFIFLSLLAILPFNVRHIFNYESIKNLEGFREHLSLSLYAFDILFIALIGTQLNIFLRNFFLHFQKKNSKKKSLHNLPLHKNFKEQILLNKSKELFQLDNLKKTIGGPYFYFVFFILLSIPFSTYPGISLYNGLRLLGTLAFFGISSKIILQSSKVREKALLIVFLSGVLQSLVAILQFFLQKSLGLKLLGESIISPEILGVSKFEFDGMKFIRSYGTFPHPNILAAFLLLSLACGMWFLFRKGKKQKTIGAVGISTGIAVIIVGIFLSYSRSVIAAAALFLVIIVIGNKNWFIEIYSEFCKKFFISKIFQGAVAIVLIFIALFGTYNLLLPRMCIGNCPGDNSTSLRSVYNQKALAIIHENPITGIGPGSFVEYTKEHLPANLQDWEFQPAHSLYLIISSEIGLFGLIAFLLIVSMEIHKKRTWHVFMENPILLVFVIFLLLGLVDHYFWTIPQGQYIFWLSLAFFSRSGKMKG